MKSHYLSFDLGASSGRAFVIIKSPENIKYEEIYRFSNESYLENNTLFWNFEEIFKNIKVAIKKAFTMYPNIRSIGIDTWGVDYGLIDFDGKLLRNPVCYRDNRTIVNEEYVNKLIDKKQLYQKTGIQYMNFNTIYQLAYDVMYHQEIIERTDKMLLMPDLIAYFLTGNQFIELTNLSTTNLYNPVNGEFVSELDRLSIPKRIIPKVIHPGEVYGIIKKEIAEELDIPQIKVVAVCSHDTASAILSIQMKKNSMYISSGTWSLVGTLLDKPFINPDTYQENYTNEIGFNKNIRFLKNVMGLWIKNQCVEQWKEEGWHFSNLEIEKMILASKPFVSYIDPDDKKFIKPKNMIEAVQEYCKNSNQVVPEGVGPILRCVYQSLVFKYRYTIERLEKLLKTSFNTITIVGGGNQIELINQMTASLCNKDVVIGFKEATIVGNALVLLLQDKEIQSIEEGRNLFNNGYKPKIYNHQVSKEYEKNYLDFCKVINRG